MDMEHEERIREIMEKMDCPIDFKCYHSGFQSICAAKDVGVEGYVDCQEPYVPDGQYKACNPYVCTFSISFGEGWLCRCPLRVFAAKKLMV